MPPATLALALDWLTDTLLALKAIAPPALRSRAVVASTSSVEMVSASEMPTPVSPDSVSPAASVITEPSCVAVTLTSPPSVVVDASLSPKMRALVSLSDTDKANTGVIAVLPAAPPSALVRIALALLANSVRSSAPLISASTPMLAWVSVSPMLRAIDAPMPNLPKPSWLALALALFSTKFSAVRLTSPGAVKVTVAPVASVALASLMPMLSASEPAMPVLTPLTPDVASASKCETVSLPPSSAGTSACSTRPSALMVPLPTRATLSTSATLTATAMPTPVPVGTEPRLCFVPAAPALRATRPVAPPALAWASVSYSVALLPLMRTNTTSPSSRPPMAVPPTPV